MAEQQKSDLDGRDYISWLSDDILLIILSKLNIPDGARTTVLSTRWRNLWTTSSVLRLDASDLIPSYTMYFQRYHQRLAKNMTLEHIVDQALAQHTGDVIDELNISYVPSNFDTPIIGLRKPWAKVDTWVEFAKQKQVKTLSLSFELFQLCQSAPYKPSPLKSLTSTTLLSLVTLRLKSPPELPDGCIESLLSSFPNLEELSIAKANSYLSLVLIKGSSLKLKHLEIIDLDIGELRISAPNLVSFNFIGRRKRGTYIRLRKVPLLTQLSYSYFDYSEFDYSEFDYSQVQFDYSFPLYGSEISTSNLGRFPARMKNLKQLKLTLGEVMDEALRLFFCLLGASPSLCKLWLNLGLFKCPLIQNHQFAINKCLVEVEIDGFAGFDSEVQLVMCIAQFSPSLKKIMIRPSLSKFSKSEKANIYTEQHNVVSAVQSLQSKLPQLELVIM